MKNDSEKNKRIVVLFSRLSDYIINIFENYINQSRNEILVFKKEPSGKEAPFKFNLSQYKTNFRNEEAFTDESLIEELKLYNPHLIICSGWSNPKYLSAVKHFHKTKPCVLTMDNQWHGTLKQRIGCLYSKLYFKKYFDKIWIPGNAQEYFAKKLGFNKEDIIKGWYVANKKFLRKTDKDTFNKRFVFVGRYVKNKGITELIDSFINLKRKTNNDWLLHCYGTGELKDKLKNHNDVFHYGFTQPEQLIEESKKGGVFVLPSHFEPWGLVVQEFALAGYPLIVSNKVGSASQFIDDKNGVIFDTNDDESLEKAMKYFTEKPESELVSMSRQSQKKGLVISEKMWIKNLNNLINIAY